MARSRASPAMHGRTAHVHQCEPASSRAWHARARHQPRMAGRRTCMSASPPPAMHGWTAHVHGWTAHVLRCEPASSHAWLDHVPCPTMHGWSCLAVMCASHVWLDRASSSHAWLQASEIAHGQPGTCSKSLLNGSTRVLEAKEQDSVAPHSMEALYTTSQCCAGGRSCGTKWPHVAVLAARELTFI